MLENQYEKLQWENGELLLGIDEAGRGPLCGPLAVAGVVFPKDYSNEDINDSKKISEKKREKLYETIINDALFYECIVVEPEEIDRLNILEATRTAMQKIHADCTIASLTLTDAMDLQRDHFVAMVKADANSISVAAASIIAKVTRDRIMMEYDEKYPEYELKKHKGYPTKRHLELLDEHGLLSIYRMSYRPCADRKDHFNPKYCK